MHLVDPFREALLRNADYTLALDLWHAEQSRLGADPTYALAASIEALAPSPLRHETLDAQEFESFLYGQREKSAQLNSIAYTLAEDCVRWIGRTQRRSTRVQLIGVTGRTLRPFAFWDVKRYSSGSVYSDPLPQDRPQNAFSQALYDSYAHTCTPEQYYDVGFLISAATQRLGETSVGKEFLHENFARCHDGAAVLADGGMGYVFRELEAIGKTATVNPWIKGGVAMAASWYGEAWATKHGVKTLQEVVSFFETRHKVTIFSVGNRSVRRARLSARGAELKAIRRAIRANGDSIAIIPVLQHEFAKNAEKAMVPLTLLAESINLAVSLHSLAKSGKTTDLVGAGNSALNAYEQLAKLSGSELRGTKNIAALGKAVKISPIGVVTGLVDVGLGVAKWDTATNRQQSVGHALSTVGSLVSMAGGATSSAGVGVIALAAGLILSQLGGWVVQIGDDCRRFLRATRWGKSTVSEGVADALIESIGERTFWLDGDIANLRDDVERQRRCVQQLAWHYEARMAWVPQLDTSLFLELRKFNPSLVAVLTTTAPRWDLDLRIKPSCPSVSWHLPTPEFETTTLNHVSDTMDVIDVSDADGPCLLIPVRGGDADDLMAKLRERPVQDDWHAVRSLEIEGRVSIHVPALGNTPSVVLERRIDHELEVGAPT